MNSSKDGKFFRTNGYAAQSSGLPAYQGGTQYAQPAAYQGQQVYSPMPAGMPSGAPYGTPAAVAPVTMTPPGEQPVTTLTSTSYTPGYLRTQIGRRVKVEFLIGTNLLVDREGILREVGTSYIIIQESETDDLLLCDMYSIKFVRFYY